MKDSACPFCQPRREVIVENDFAIAIYDAFAVSRGHALVVPKRHVDTVWDLTDGEFKGCFLLLKTTKEILQTKLEPDGFNIGVNCGAAAGQSVWHAHIHLIPRYTGDVPEPRGGVRHVIPLKGNY